MKDTGVRLLYDHYRYNPMGDETGKFKEAPAKIGTVRGRIKPFKSLEKMTGGRVRAESTHQGLFHNKTPLHENDILKRGRMSYKVLIMDFNSGIETDMIRAELEGTREDDSG